MIFFQGFYHFLPKTTAFRRDYCRSCQEVRTLTQIRTADFYHLYWIPVLPLGLWKRWKCAGCGNKPYRHTKTSRAAKAFLALVLAVITFEFWFEPDLADEFSSQELLICRIGISALLAFALVWLKRHSPELTREQGHALVPHLAIPNCLLCGGPMQRGTPDHCQICNRKHLPVPREQ
ncbi:MAG: hypothetical protein JKY61_06945 [Planctomycetes bacterium]|nr:hypothetical protein [Planctomycetota bacterium]